MADANVHNIQNIIDFKALIDASPNAPATTESTASSLIAIDFYATWCPPCKVIAPKFVELAHEFNGRARFYKVDVDEVPEAAQELGVSAMPTFVFLKGGEEVGKVVGANLKGIRDVVEKNV